MVLLNLSLSLSLLPHMSVYISFFPFFYLSFSLLLLLLNKIISNFWYQHLISFGFYFILENILKMSGFVLFNHRELFSAPL